MLAATLLVVVWAAGTAFAAPDPSSQKQAPAAVASATCIPAPGQQVATQSFNGQANLGDVVAISANDIWAVGTYITENAEGRGIILHWNGASWSSVPGPSGLPEQGYSLVSVDGTSANDIWAIGAAYGDGTLTIHWDGTAWTRVASPNRGNTLIESLDTISANDAWAVGSSADGSNNFAIHWDGTQWSISSTPDPFDYTNALHSVSGLTSNDVWAVGEGNDTSVALHWDGTQWTSVAVPQVGNGGNLLFSVAMVTSDDVWAMGQAQYGPSSVIVHWDGTAWTGAPSPNITGIPRNIEVISASDIWVVGIQGSVMFGPSFVAHWDGADWSPVSEPQGLYEDTLFGVTASSSGDVWAVGSYKPHNYPQPLVLHFVSAPCGAPTYTPTLTPTPEPTLPACSVISNYDEVETVGTLVPGSTLVPGTQCHDCTANIALPFTYFLYNQPYNTAVAGSNGVLNFEGNQNDPFNECLPDVGSQAAIFPYWDHLDTSAEAGPGLGIYTSISGSAPGRIFNIEWRACRYAFGPCGGHVDFEVRLYENQNKFDIVLGQQESSEGSESSATLGVQGNAQAGLYTLEFCDLVEAREGATLTFNIAQFTDITPDSTFYPYIHCLACHGIVSGYADGTYRPNNNVTRGQLAKIVSNAAGFTDDQPNQIFEDVPVGSTFQLFVGRLASRGYIGGYTCGGPNEPCGSGNLPYFRPNSNATRGQISKIDSNAAGYADTPAGQQFEDVPVGSTYYAYTYRLVSRGIMSGYPCGGAGEPCVAPANHPYFRPNNNATRGQSAKIVSGTFYPDCPALQAIKK